MKPKTQHTPTPWEVGEYTASEVFKQLSRHQAIMKPDGSLLATTGPAGHPASLEDAAFIVRAVNSHEALLDALKTWQKFWDKMPKGQMGKLSFDVGLFNDGFVKMGKAIAQAEGQ